jgi:5-oxopent-3-ene-1,2,5-tricarboxylate decarboxylase/2-hydroxyhepta-2,4-diene-1,7-dioate isomerase
MLKPPPNRQLVPGAFDPELTIAPWRLSGTVVGPLLNDPAALRALGDAASAPPYKALPRAPVMFIKPRNTLAGSGATIAVPSEHDLFELGATVGLVIGRSTCKVAAREAMNFVAGCTLVIDLSVPHTSYYRPSVRFKARDGSCLLGPRVVARADFGTPDVAVLNILVDGTSAREISMAGMRRPAAQLIEDVSEFMTLHAGDVLMLGTRYGMPLLRDGQTFAVDCAGIGRLEGRLEAEEAGVCP